MIHCNGDEKELLEGYKSNVERLYQEMGDYISKVSQAKVIIVLLEDHSSRPTIATGYDDIVVDCDNVLWGGILSEVGMENLRLGSSGLGKEYQDFQRFLLALYHRGVLLAVCSKKILLLILSSFYRRLLLSCSAYKSQKPQASYFLCESPLHNTGACDTFIIFFLSLLKVHLSIIIFLPYLAIPLT